MNDTPGMSARAIGGFRVLNGRTAALIELLNRRRADGQRTELLFANTNFVVQCQPMAEQLAGPETLIVNDGIGMDLASWLFHRRPFVDNLAGTDFVPRYLAGLDRPTRVFLLGARPASVLGTARRWRDLPNVEIVAAVDGYDGMADEARLLAQLRAARPDLLFVALGDPRQEQWIVAHRHLLDVPLTIAVGAVFDFVSGSIWRAPAIFRRLRLEWLHRLVLEPRRLAKRYSVDLVVFFAHCLRAHRRARRAARVAARPAA